MSDKEKKTLNCKVKFLYLKKVSTLNKLITQKFETLKIMKFSV